MEHCEKAAADGLCPLSFVFLIFDGVSQLLPSQLIIKGLSYHIKGADGLATSYFAGELVSTMF